MLIVCVISLSAFSFFIWDGQREWMEWAGLSVSLLCILHCISLSLSTVFFFICSTVFLSFVNCISFSLWSAFLLICSTVFLSVYDQHFFYLFNCISFSLWTVFPVNFQIKLCNPSPALSETSREAGWSRLACQCPPAITSFVRHLFLTNIKQPTIDNNSCWFPHCIGCVASHTFYVSQLYQLYLFQELTVFPVKNISSVTK